MADGNGNSNGGRWSWVGILSSGVLMVFAIGAVCFTVFGYGATANSALDIAKTNSGNIDKIEANVARLQSDLASLRTELAGWEKAQNDDHIALTKLVDNQESRGSILTALQENFREVETQFCADEQIRNVLHAEELRIRQMLIQKAFPGADYSAANATYPEICQRSGR